MSMICSLCGSEDVAVFQSGAPEGFCRCCNQLVPLLQGEPAGPRELQIFFSYGHDTHSDFVLALKNRIEEKTAGRIRVWIDKDRIRANMHWRSAIADGIRSSQGVVAFLSQHSAREAGVCRDELAIAISCKHGMIRSVLLEDPKTFAPPARATEYQWEDMSDYPTYRDQGDAVWNAYIDEKADRIIRELDSEDIQRYDREMKLLRSKLLIGMTDAATRLDRLMEKDMVGRHWVTEEVQRWVEDPKGKRFMLLYGKPGSGKSMFASHLQYYNPWVAGALACDHQSKEYSDTDSITNHLAYRLAMRLPDYRGTLMYYYSDSTFAPGRGKDRFAKLIAEPLSRCNINGDRGTMVILIDGLDEVETGDLTGYLQEYGRELAPWLRILITARKEPEILEAFRGYPYIDYDERQEENRADHLTYYRQRLDDALSGRSEAQREAFYERLLASGEGVFFYASLVCDMLLEELEADPSMDLIAYPLPRGLYPLFRKTLDRKNFRHFARDGRELSFQGFWQIPLGMVLSSPEPLPVTTLKALMDWGENEYMSFHGPLSTLLEEKDGVLVPFHRSFGEWLNSPDAQGGRGNTRSYYTSKADGTKNLAQAAYDLYTKGLDKLDEFLLYHLTTLLLQANLPEAYATLKKDRNYMNRLFDLEEHYREHSSFDRSLPLAKSMAEQFRSHADLYDREMLSAWLDGLGRNYLAQQLIQEAEEVFSQALDISKQLVEANPQNPQYRRDLSVSLDRVADVKKANQDLPGAMVLYEENLEIHRQLAEEYPQNPLYRRDLSISLHSIADVKKANQDLPGAMVLYEESLEIRRQLAGEYPQNPQYRRDLSISLSSIADVKKANQDLPGAMVLYEESLEVARQLAGEYPQNPEYRRDLSVSLNRVADVKNATQDLSGAMVLYEESLNLHRQLVEDFPKNPQYRRDLSVCLERVADVKNATQDLSGAMALYEESLNLHRQLTEGYPKNPEHHRDLSVCLERVADVKKANQDLPGALVLYKESLEIARQLTEAYPRNPAYRQDLSRYLSRVADIKNENQDLPGALVLYEESLEIAEQLAEDYPQNPDYLRDLSISLKQVADVKKEPQDLPEAIELYAKSMEIQWQLVDMYPENPQYVEDLAVSYFYMGVFTRESFWFALAKETALKAPHMPMCMKTLKMLP